MDLLVEVDKQYEKKQIDTRWTQIRCNKSICARSYFGCCIQAGKIYVHGGYNPERGILGDMYSLFLEDDVPTWQYIPQLGDSPGKLRNHILLSYISYLLLIGGQKNMIQNNSSIYKYDLRMKKWQKCIFLDKKISITLQSHASFIYNHHLYIFGGFDSTKGQYQNQIFKINLQNIKDGSLQYSKIQCKNNPSPRAGMGSCLMYSDFYIFGGYNDDHILDDFWFYKIENNQWIQIKQQNQKFWPERRKGHTLASHQSSNNIFMFGGFKELTQQQNQITIFMVNKKKWLKVHENTNQLYNSSPTTKKQIEDSPRIIKHKMKKNNPKYGGFKLNIANSTCYGGMKNVLQENFRPTTVETSNKQRERSSGRKMSAMREKKYKEFIVRKKKLLDDISKKNITYQHRKTEHSPTSEALIYSLKSIGQQAKTYNKNNLPKVIYDKNAVIGKKPCARDGHAAVVHGQFFVIFGGDRHTMPFNDLYTFKMTKAIENCHYYEKQK